MAISNNNTGIRTGVCTSTTRPTAPYEGQMIYETDTDLTYIWGGSAWQQVSGGTAVGNSGLVYVAGGSFSGVTSFDVTGFSSSFLFYDLKITIAGTSACSGQLVSGSTVVNTTYYGSTFFSSYLSASGIVAVRNADATFYLSDLNGAPPTQISAIIRGVSQNEFCITYTGFETLNVRTITGGYSNFANPNSFDKIRFSSAANMAGSWSLMGVRKP